MNAACAQQIQQANLFLAVFAVIVTLNIVSFYGWRRLRAAVPWRTALFVVFAICSLVVFDIFALAVVYAFAPSPTPAASPCK